MFIKLQKGSNQEADQKYTKAGAPQLIEHVTTWHGFPLSRHIKLPFYSPLHDNASAENVV